MSDLPRKTKNKKWWALWLVVAVALVGFIVAAINREWIRDWYRGMTYEPSSEMVRIRDDLKLTDYGKFLFNAAQPVLSEATEFNEQCRKEESETAVLGCYVDGNIYVYNIVDSELDGIRELTVAHELLHAKWARMGDDEKNALVEPLAQAFEANHDFLSREINQYDISEKQEELYVRAGTEVKDLPEQLEKHFAGIFRDQDAAVDFYNKYIEVFRRIKNEMEELTQEMQELQAEISNKTAIYEAQYAQLEADVVSFNSCAAVVGCFSGESEFYLRRNGLLVWQDELNIMNEEINGLINQYNEKVDLYNANVTESHKLQNMINSTAQALEI